MPAPNLGNAADRDLLLARIRQVRVDSPRQWGRMTPQEMVCHLTESFKFALGEKEARYVGNFASRTLIRWIALHTPLKWAKGIPTIPEIDQKRNSTQSDNFHADLAGLIRWFERFTSAAPDCRRPPHPYFGALTEEEWNIWAWRHIDHHLRQFGT